LKDKIEKKYLIKKRTKKLWGNRVNPQPELWDHDNLIIKKKNIKLNYQSTYLW
jgi:hypothetical protein